MAEDGTGEPSSSSLKEHWQLIVTLVLLIGFGALVLFLITSADGATEIVWQRRVYLFGAVEAVLFTAIGWLFGREVSRSATESARQEAATAREDARAARDEAKEQAVGAAEAKVDAERERAKAETVAAVVEHTTAAPETPMRSKDASFADPDDAPAGTTIDLPGLLRDLYPRRP